jgi:hypothetical protein
MRHLSKVEITIMVHFQHIHNPRPHPTSHPHPQTLNRLLRPLRKVKITIAMCLPHLKPSEQNLKKDLNCDHPTLATNTTTHPTPTMPKLPDESLTQNRNRDSGALAPPSPPHPNPNNLTPSNRLMRTVNRVEIAMMVRLPNCHYYPHLPHVYPIPTPTTTP